MRWRAKYAGHVVADSENAIVLQEADYPPVVYFPRADVSMEYMSRTDRSTHCPYKGDASYFTLAMDGQIAENSVWSYELPYPAMEEIAERVAFYPNKVEVYAVEDAAVNPHPEGRKQSQGEDFTITVDDVVLHTDSGSGNAQREHWAANVSTPEKAEDELR
jgi:uncharacterized protein (DUF427 family)